MYFLNKTYSTHVQHMALGECLKKKKKKVLLFQVHISAAWQRTDRTQYPQYCVLHSRKMSGENGSAVGSFK